MNINFLKTHLFYILLIAGMVLAGRMWLQEHDARVLAEQTVKARESDVKVLQSNIVTVTQQMQANDAKAASSIAALQKALASVKTPTQAIAAIPSVSDLPLHSRVAVDNPTQVSVDALPLFQELNECKQDAVQLQACTMDLASQKQIDADKDKQIADKNAEIKALTKKKSLFKRIVGRIKDGLIDFAIFEGASAVLHGGKL
jgi:hypothetical protein